MYFPLRGDSKAEGHVGDDFLYFEWASSFHLELLGSVHVEVSCFQPDFVSYSPRGKLGVYLFLHLLLSHFVGLLVHCCGQKISQIAIVPSSVGTSCQEEGTPKVCIPSSE